MLSFLSTAFFCPTTKKFTLSTPALLCTFCLDCSVIRFFSFSLWAPIARIWNRKERERERERERARESDRVIERVRERDRERERERGRETERDRERGRVRVRVREIE